MNPSPSVVVAETATDAPPSAPTATASASDPARREPGSVRLHLHRDVADAPSRLAHQRQRAREESLSVGAVVLGTIRAEMRADVAEPRCGQQRVDDRMGDGVTVGMTRQRGLTRPFQVREPQRAGTSEAVHVGADPDARCLGVREMPTDAAGDGRDEAAGAVQVHGRRDLEREVIARDRSDGVTRRGDQCRVIREVVRHRAVGGIQDVPAESLGRLGGGELGPSTAATIGVALDPLDRVDDGKDGNGTRQRPRRSPR